MGRKRQLNTIFSASPVCVLSPPPAIRFSVSTLEKTGAQILFLSGGYVPSIRIPRYDETSFFTWPCDINNDEIMGKWKVSPDGRKIEGTWSHSHGLGPAHGRDSAHGAGAFQALISKFRSEFIRGFTGSISGASI